MKTIEINSVADLRTVSEQPPKVIASDWDHTLVDFDAGHAAGMQAISNLTNATFAKRVNEIFQFLVRGNRVGLDEQWSERADHDRLLDSFKEYQVHDLEKYGSRRWSREIWLVIAARELGFSVTPAFITQLREAYWEAVSQNATIFPEVPEFLEWLKIAGIALIVMTGSDSVVTIYGEDSIKLQYTPQDSWDYKLKRITRVPAQKILIGDPHDKPKQEFFEGVYHASRELGAQEKSDTWFVGDSMGGDLSVPHKDGYPTFLVKRRK